MFTSYWNLLEWYVFIWVETFSKYIYMDWGINEYNIYDEKINVDDNFEISVIKMKIDWL